MDVRPVMPNPNVTGCIVETRVTVSRLSPDREPGGRVPGQDHMQVNLKGAKKHHDTIRDMMATSSNLFSSISRGSTQMLLSFICSFRNKNEGIWR
jgi:hypothetical protein